MAEPLDEDALQQLYTWIDEIPLSRPKRNIVRDFSDGVLVAEIVYHFIPKMVDLHNYSPANSTTQKLDNWNLLKRRCFGKLQYNIEEDYVKGVVACKPGIVELVLAELREHIEGYVSRQKAAIMMEQNQMHDEVSTGYEQHEAMNETDQAEINGYDQSGQNYNSYNGYVPYDPYTQQQTVDMQYQFNSQPHAVQDIRTNTTKRDQCLSPKRNSEDGRTTKPVTQASKPKTKTITSSSKNSAPNDVTALRLMLEEKEQALLASQETVQILQAKIRRLEHLLHLKDLRINEFKSRQPQGVLPPESHPLPAPPQPQLINPQTRQITYAQTFPLSAGYASNQFQPHPPLPQIPRPPFEDGRKYQR